jgi:collagenase-like PrtC family protease
MCFKTPSRKENFEEEPKRKVLENTVRHRVKGRQVGWKKIRLLSEMTREGVASWKIAGRQ